MHQPPSPMTQDNMRMYSAGKLPLFNDHERCRKDWLALMTPMEQRANAAMRQCDLGGLSALPDANAG
jgi:hypothetical protein